VLIEATLAATFVAALVVLVAPDRWAPRLGLAGSLLPLVGSLWMYWQFEGTGNALLEGGDIAFETNAAWLSAAGYELRWFVGLDGISLPLVVLTGVLTPLAVLAAWTPIDERKSQFYALVLFIEAALLGVFVALDFFVWFVFWEAVLIPMYLLIAVWGGPRRKYAAVKFLVYTNVASLVLFGAFMALVFGLGDSVTSFSLPEIAMTLNTVEPDALGWIDAGTLKTVAFVAMFAGFGVKVPIVPFHTWLPDAHVEAPTPASVILAGVLLKMGTYALLRFNFTMLSGVASDLAVPIAIVAVVSVVYGAMLALAQQDLKRIVAYSSISSMGYVILGLVAYTTYGVGGATFQMISHGLLSGLMFMSVGVIYNVTHTRMVGDLSGIADRMPVTAAVFVAGAFGYMGLPLMSGFAGEVFVFLGSFGSTVLPDAPIYTAAAMFGIVIVAGYLLLAMQRTLFGEYRVDTDYDAHPAARHDLVALVAAILLVVALGVAPEILYDMIQDAANPVVALLGGGA
jgi:NADH-quinone oxidoreductase subunit M